MQYLHKIFNCLFVSLYFFYLVQIDLFYYILPTHTDCTCMQISLTLDGYDSQVWLLLVYIYIISLSKFKKKTKSFVNEAGIEVYILKN